MPMPQLRRRPVERRPALRTKTVLICCALATLSAFMLCGWMLSDAREDATRQADQAAGNIAAAVEQDVARNIELFDLSLQAVIDGLQLPGIGELSAEMRHRVLFDRSASARYLAFINALDATGSVIADSQQTQYPTNWSSRDYFIAHRRDASLGIYIGRPFATTQDELAGITISRRMSHPDGTFAGVVVGGMRLAYFRELFSRLQLGPHGSIALLRIDGTNLMRLPFDRNDVGRVLDPGSPLHAFLRTNASPVVAKDAIDRVDRRFTFRRVGDLPLVVAVGLATEDIYAAWWARTMFVGFALLVVLLVNGGLAARLLREARRRETTEQASRKKSEFLATLSHELRTPLHGILGYADRLGTEGTLDSAQSRCVAAIADAGRHMRDVVNRVLDQTRVEARGPEPQMRRIDVRELLEQCRALVEPGATARGLPLHCSVAPGVPGLFVTDAARLRQVLVNLLGNAVKFTWRGRIDVRLGGNEERIRFEVADTGVGVPGKRRHRLFQDYERLGAEESGIEGAGLGLAMAARLVRGMGGDIGHRDNQGGGSVFWFDLPAGKEAAAKPAVAETAAPVRRGLRVLVADDTAMGRDVAGAFLGAAGHHVTLAQNGSEVVELAASEDFDVVLMDMRMPVQDGIEATRRIRALGGPRGQVPIVAVTANALDRHVQECRDAGMAGYLAKPFVQAELLAVIGKAVGRCGETAKVIDHEILARLAGQMSVEELDGHLRSLALRIEALLRLLKAPDAFAAPEALADMVQELAGSAGALGFMALSAIARRLQTTLAADPMRATRLVDAFRRAAQAALAELRQREPA